MPRRALVVDDSRAVRVLLRRLLSSLDFEVHEACDGEEALRRLGELGPLDLALVDWNMPRMDGLSFIKAVRADLAYERMALVMVTSESAPAHIARALMSGADEYALKPMTREALVDKLALVGLAPEEP
jgi:two-component system chemotaxis response regulator CheY